VFDTTLKSSRKVVKHWLIGNHRGSSSLEFKINAWLDTTPLNLSQGRPSESRNNDYMKKVEVFPCKTLHPEIVQRLEDEEELGRRMKKLKDNEVFEVIDLTAFVMRLDVGSILNSEAKMERKKVATEQELEKRKKELREKGLIRRKAARDCIQEES